MTVELKGQLRSENQLGDKLSGPAKNNVWSLGPQNLSKNWAVAPNHLQLQPGDLMSSSGPGEHQAHV